MTWTREEIAWVTGLFDGEGCISAKTMNSGSDYTRLQLVMADEDLVRRAQAVFGLGTVIGPFYPNGNPQWQPVWRWSVTGQFDVLAVLVAMWPWLGLRRQQRARQAIEQFYERPRRYKRPNRRSA